MKHTGILSLFVRVRHRRHRANRHERAGGTERCRCRTAFKRRWRTTSTCRSSASIRKSRFTIWTRPTAATTRRFNISGTHNYNVSPGGFQFHIPPTRSRPRITDGNSFNSGISGGLLPWGLQYSFSGGLSENYGNRPSDNSSANVGVTLTQPLLKNFWIDSTRLNIRVAKNHLQ